MNRTPSRRAVFLAALLSCLLLPAVFLAQSRGPKALVVCPPSDSAGCQRIAEQLRLTKSPAGGSVFPGGVDTKYAELRTMTVPELQSYAVVVVPSLANEPYNLFREDAVKLRLLQVLRGRIVVWSGTPDRGSATGKSAGKLTLIQNLARWAAGQYGDGTTGLVVLQDFSNPNPDGSSPRYSWIQGIAGARLDADVTVRSYNSVQKNSANPAAAEIVGSLAYDNMASFGLAVPSGPGVVGAWGLTGTGKNATRGQAVLVTFARAPGASHPVGPEGGTITSGRVTLSIPAGALSQTTYITIEPHGPVSDSGYVKNSAYSFGPDGLTFAKPATLTIGYDDGEVPSYVVEDSLHLFRQAESSTTWEEVPGSADPAANRVTGTIGGFSRYSIKARPPGVPPGPPNPVPPNKGAAAVNVTPDTASVQPAGTKTLTAKATDKKGVGLPGRVVNWTHSGAGLGFTLSAAVDTTDANGEATTIVTVPTTAGVRDTVTATVDGKTDRSIITVVAGAADSIFAFSGNGTTRAVGSVDSIRAKVTDQHGNPIAGHTVQWAAGSGSGSVSPSSSVTGANGVAAAAWTLGTTAGPQTATATATGLSGSPVTFTATATAGAAAQLAITTQPPDTAQSGVALATHPVIQLQDQYGNAVGQSGVAITARIGSGGGTVRGDSVESTTAGGQATFDNLAICGTVGPRTLTFVSGSLTPATSESVELVAGPADSMAIHAGNGQSGQAGSPVATAPAVLVIDGCGNPVSGVSVTFTPSADGQVTGSPAATNASGIATVGSWTLRTTGGVDSLTASATGINPVVFTATVGASAADTIFVFSGNNATREVASTDSIRVKVTDAHGNPVAGHTVAWAAGAGSGSMSPSSSATDANGVAAAAWTLGTAAGPQTATATATGLGGSPVAFSATATAGPPAAVSVTPARDTIPAGGTTGFTAAVTDQYGNPIASPTVSWISSNTGAATVNPATGTSTTATGASPLAADDSTYIIATSGSAADSATLLVLAVAPPDAKDDAFTTSVSTTLNGDLTDDNGSGADNLGTPPGALASFGGGSLGGAVTDNAAGASVALAGGTLTVGSSGTFSLTNPTTAGTYTFLYRLTNSTGSDDATVTITVQQGPDAKDDAFAVLPGITLNGDLKVDNGNGADVLGTPAATLASFGGGSLGGAVTDNAAGASVAFAGGTLTVNADGTFSLTSPTTTGTHTFLYRLTNPVGSDDATVTITVQRPPDAKDDAFTTTTPTSVNGNLTADNGSGADDLGDPAGTVASYGGGSLGGGAGDHAAGSSTPLAGGSLTVNANGTFSLTSPTVGGTYTFRYRLSNAAGTDSATVTITVNQPPTANDDAAGPSSAPGDAFHTPFNTALVAPGGNTPSLLGNDVVGFPAATVASFGGGSLPGDAGTNPAGTTVVDAEGSLTVNANGSFTFTPASGFTGLFTFNYRLSNTPGSDDALVTIAVGVRPSADSDTYPHALVGNVKINTATSSQFTVLDGDQGDAVTINVTSSPNGTVTMGTDGKFTFNPNPGFTGAATFQYTLTNGFGTTPAATVSLTVNGLVWFVNSAGSAGGDGRIDTPFNCLVDAGAACYDDAADDPNDNIFAYSGSYANSGPVVLLNGQKLIGQGASGATLSTIAGVSWPADAGAEPTLGGTSPTLTGGGVTLNGASGANTLRGFNIGNVTGSAISGTSFGTLNVSQLGINTTGQALSLTTGTISGSFNSITSTGGTNNISLSGINSAAAIDLGNGALSGATGAAVTINGGSVGLTYAGTISQTNNAALLSVSGGHTGTLTFNTGTLSATSGTGLQFDNADGSYQFNGTVTLNGGDAAIDIVNGSGGSFSFPSSSTITNPSGVAFNVNGGAGPVTYAGTISKNNAGNVVSIQGRSGGTLALSGNISATGTSSGILLQNNTGGTLTFSGAAQTLTTAGNPGVSLTNNSGATINFSGGALAITTTVGNGFNASNGGTVTVTGANNTISSTGGIALNLVSNTTIGASGLTFKTISATGGTNGIVLNSTGTLGGLTVTGTGTTAGSGGTIQGMTGNGVQLVSTKAATLQYMNITNNNGSGLFGDELTDFTLLGASVTNNDADHPTGTNESGLFFNELYGTNTIRGSTISGTKGDNIRWETLGGAQGTLKVVKTTLGPNPVGTGANGFAIFAINNASITAVVDSSVVSGNQTAGFLTSFDNTATYNVTVTRSKFDGNGTFTFTHDTLYNHRSNAINVISSAVSTGSTNANGTVANNVVGNGSGQTGSDTGNGIGVSIRGGADVAMTIANNLVRNTELRPILAEAEGTGRVDFTITANTAGPPVDPFNGSIEGIFVSAEDSRTLCLNMTGNTSTGQNQTGYRVRQADTSIFQLQGFAGTGTSTASVSSFIQSNNTGTASVQTGGTGTVVNYTSGTCNTTAF